MAEKNKTGYLEGLANEFEREYEICLTKLVVDGVVEEEWLLGIVNKYNDKVTRGITMDSVATQESVAYNAFYCLNILYRQSMDPKKLDVLFRMEYDWVKKHESYSHLRVLRRLQLSGERGVDDTEYLKMAYETASRYPENAGYQHAFADLFATLCEKNEDRQAEYIKEWGNKAIKCADRAIADDKNYAKYYCTKGRICALLQEYAEADKLIENAIATEDSTKKDYALRIANYQYHRLQIQAQKLSDTSEIRKEVEQLKSSVTSSIEIIGFFSGIVSFVIGSLTLAQGQTAFQAAMLIAILMGALLTVFAAFCILLRGGKKTKAHIIVAIIGLLIVLGGCWIVYRA